MYLPNDSQMYIGINMESLTDLFGSFVIVTIYLS
jgi:hypothetical protein